MIIHSKFKDYYDAMAFLGHDEHVYYIRETTELDEKVVPWTVPKVSFYFRNQTYKGNNKRWNHGDGSAIRSGETTFRFRPVWVVFCGKIFVGIRMFAHKKSELVWRRGLEREDSGPVIFEKFFWSKEKFEKQIAGFGKESAKYPWGLNSWFTSIHHVDIWDLPKLNDTFLNWTVEKRIVSMLYVDSVKPHWLTEPYLLGVGFQQAVEASQAWQEIEMWLSGALSWVGSPPLVTLSDESVAKKHGLDKWSFRKVPERK